MINIKTDFKEYSILIENNILSCLPSRLDFSKFSKIVILTDENLIRCGWLEKLDFSLSSKIDYISIFPGEINKNMQTIEKIWKSMNNFSMDRKSLLINLGGGMICDLGAFCASTYMRGMEFLQIPTTLLSQVDASVGGKTGFDFNGVKNIIGTFAEPYAVIIDPITLRTLPEREYISGLAEVIKYGIIWDKDFFKYLHNKRIEDSYIIKKSCQIKAEVVEKDFREKSIRKTLNFGHTIGHAVESLSLNTGNPLLHGEAVAIGMAGESYIASRMEYMNQEELNIVENTLKIYNLPTKYEGNLNDIYPMLFKDKKNVSNKIKWVLPDHIGQCFFDKEVDENIIKDAITYILK